MFVALHLNSGDIFQFFSKLPEGHVSISFVVHLYRKQWSCRGGPFCLALPPPFPVAGLNLLLRIQKSLQTGSVT